MLIKTVSKFVAKAKWRLVAQNETVNSQAQTEPNTKFSNLHYYGLRNF